jgi:hypothetical protein
MYEILVFLAITYYLTKYTYDSIKNDKTTQTKSKH